jgi:ethanolamine ammonia-lyase small subunit
MDSPDSHSPAPRNEGCDPWRGLSRYTTARIALGRAGGSARTDSILDFRMAHALARDAVMRDFDAPEVGRQLTEGGIEWGSLDTRARDRREYLLNPGLGRTLSESSLARIRREAPQWGHRHLALVISDGLSALAAERHAVRVVEALVPRLREAGWTVFPVFIVSRARVGLLDVLGEALQCRHGLILLGERPGLGAPDSLGAYFAFEPRPGQSDADRNCVSNIRPDGLPPARAAEKLAWLLGESERRQCSGVRLKDSFPPVSRTLPAGQSIPDP